MGIERESTVGIRAIGSYLPEGRVDNLARITTFGKDGVFVKEKLGFTKLARKSTDEETSDLCVRACENLLKQVELPLEEVDCLIVCTQNPDAAGLPHTSAIVHAKLGLGTSVAAFDISLGCSGYVYGLSVICSFMEMNGLGSGLLFTADPYSKVLDSADHNTELLFGDGATVTWLSRDKSCYQLGRSLFSTNGTGQSAIHVDSEERKVHMKGRSVFNFTMKVVPQQIKACLAANDCTVNDVDYFLLHQGSKFIVDNMTASLGLPPEKTPFMAAEYGNTISSSIPMMLKTLLGERPEKILISGFGVGLSWATSLLFRDPDNC
ncbi:MAG: 3-oxoacyl-ACP synthase [endosymbiont of Seepiophila jonesi]|uniref:3-oxoacyl-ACP synthase n=1 Tax=endosymbiont of Lamellibrachia luymesi TaxID=2200907 RepID=A0A370DWF0_9GAMM|nr:MAG: 3-oxoacyl-ACP synthase [endosymbiont of Lamellibrachia luymesi]RDH92715.1 MAG: 3-oxoacyl-ACP synthase [endosymbiont of Seepiophila jonesi]